MENIGDDILKVYEQGLEDGKPKWIPVAERLPKMADEYIKRKDAVIKAKQAVFAAFR